jgi:hypothetical protein
MVFRPAGASGGNNCYLGVYNAYNRVMTSSRSVDTNSYSNTSGTWRSTDASNSHRASFIDGLGQSSITVLGAMTATTGGAGPAQYSYGLDSTTTPSASITPAYSGTGFGTMTVVDTLAPQLGFHYVQSLESGAAGVTFYNSSIHIQLEM